MHGRVGKRNFPLVPGHEITGVVAAVGTEVTKHQVGDLVSVGCMVNSCRRCASRRAGEEQYCAGGAPVNVDAYLSLLGTGGTMVMNVGLPAERTSLSAFSIVLGRKNLVGSLYGHFTDPGNARFLR